MITLGIESSCDETALCLINEKKILAESISSSAKNHEKFGGVVPEIASRKHLEFLIPCLKLVLKKTNTKLKDIELISATRGPGLVGSLLIGVASAKALALAKQIPLIFVDHVEAHAYAAKFQNPKIIFPFVSLVVSGGHTLIFKVMAPNKMKVLGQTIDDAAGEAFDKVAYLLKLGYPGGPLIEQLAKGNSTDIHKFPRPKIKDRDFNFSFSGLKTSVYYRVKEHLKTKKLTKKFKSQFAYSFQEAACDCLVKKSIEACLQHNIKTLTIGGGVSANQTLRQKMTKAAEDKGIRVYFPQMQYCVDNATMIAALGQDIVQTNRKNYVSKRAQREVFAQEPYPEYPVEEIKPHSGS